MPSADDAITSSAPASSLHRLLNRGLPVKTYYLRHAPADEVEAAEQAVAEALEAQGMAMIRLDEYAEDARQAAEQKVAEARAVLAACFTPVRVRALDPEVYEALLDAHKDDSSESGTDDMGVGRQAFLAGVQGDLDEAQWDDVLNQCSRAERRDLYITALQVNVRTTGGTVPKG